MEHIWDSDFITEKVKCALLDILHEIPSDSDLLDPSAAPSVVASLFKKQSTALLTTFRSKEVAEADPAVTIKVIFLLRSRVPGGEIKRDPEIGKTAIQPEPAQTADLSISGSHLISSLCK